MMNLRFLSISALEFAVAAAATFLVPASFPDAQAAPGLLQQFPVKGGVKGERTTLFRAAPGAKSGTRAPRVQQSQVAGRGAFPTVPNAQLKGALDAKNLPLLKKYVGKTSLCVGVVTAVYTPKSGSIVLINFAPNYKNALVGAVKARDFKQFPDLRNLKGQRVALRGRIILFKGSPEIELPAAGAIRIVK